MALTDFLDIIVTSILIYGVIELLRKTRSVFAVLGVIILALIYTLARFLNLYLTTSILQIFFGLLLIALIVIFQNELRRFFELLALWGGGIWWRRRRSVDLDHIATIAHVAQVQAEQKVGLLLVIVGKESLTPHLSGGFDLNGNISEPLLRSIFDPHTPGHDGAVIVEGNKIKKFGVHLPLSDDFSQITHYGTRHSAGLGITEKSDALGIIVSEERGRISLARDSRLKSIENEQQLEQEMRQFVKDKFNSEKKSFRENLINWLAQDLRGKILALLIAISAWFIFVWPGR